MLLVNLRLLLILYRALIERQGRLVALRLIRWIIFSSVPLIALKALLRRIHLLLHLRRVAWRLLIRLLLLNRRWHVLRMNLHRGQSVGKRSRFDHHPPRIGTLASR